MATRTHPDEVSVQECAYRLRSDDLYGIVAERADERVPTRRTRKSRIHLKRALDTCAERAAARALRADDPFYEEDRLARLVAERDSK